MFPALSRLSTVTRVAVAVTVVLVFGTVMLATIAYVLLDRRLSADMDRALLQETDAFTAAVGTSPLTTPDDLADATRAYMEGRPMNPEGLAVLLLVRFTDGSVIANSPVSLEHSPENAANVDPATATRSFDTVALEGSQYRVATVPFYDAGGKTVAVFQAAVPLGINGDITDALLRTLFFSGLLVVLVGTGLSALVARTSLRPLHEVARTTRTITQTSLSRRVPYSGPQDDVGAMVGAVNDMLDRLERAFAEQKHFTADASHELRTPLTIIRGHLEVMRYDAELSAEQEATISLVLEEVERMARLVDDLLALSRLDAGVARPFVPLQLETVVQEAVARGEAMAPRRFLVGCTGTLPVRGDHDMLMQVLLNLIANAVNATTSGGTIMITCDRTETEAMVRVQDDGPGVDPDQLDRMFERFSRGRGTPRPPDGSGSGLGLAIARRLAERHGGSLSAGNAFEGGAVLTLTVPLDTRPWTPLERRRLLGRATR